MEVFSAYGQNCSLEFLEERGVIIKDGKIFNNENRDGVGISQRKNKNGDQNSIILQIGQSYKIYKNMIFRIDNHEYIIAK